jgi:hypothetical protein
MSIRQHYDFTNILSTHLLSLRQKPAIIKHHLLLHLLQNENMTETVQLSYPYILDKAKEKDNKRALRKLTKIGNPPYDVETK